jgi:hypothetical protein
VFFFSVAKRDLSSIVPVSVLGFYLGHRAGTRFYDGAWSLLTIGGEDTGHPDFLTDNTFHLIQFVPSQVEETVMGYHRLQSPFATDLFHFPSVSRGGSTGSKLTRNG